MAWSVYKGDKTPDTYRWQNHPAVLMWEDHKLALKLYYDSCLLEWSVIRKHKNNMPFFQNPHRHFVQKSIHPNWYDDNFITSHRCRLLQKNYDFYSQYNWIVPDNWREIDYIWPVRKSE